MKTNTVHGNSRILHILARALRGGVEKNCYHIVKATPQFQHTIAILDGEGPMVTELQTAGATIHVLNLLRKGRVTFQRQLRGRFPDGPFSCIIVWTNLRMPIVVHSLNRFNADIFVHVGNPVRVSWTELLQSLFFRPKNPVNLRPVSAYVEKSLSSSPYYRKFPRKVSLKPIVAPSVMVKEPVPLARDSCISLGMVARLDTIKDHRTVIDAFNIIHREYPNAILNLVGAGPLLESLKHTAANKGLSSNVIFHGDVADVYGAMKDWDLFLYGTTVSEGLGGTVAEALSMGLPTVATDLPMVREWDPKGQYITFCKASDPPDMAMKALTLLSDVARRTKINRAAPAYIRENFSPEKFAYNYISKP